MERAAEATADVRAVQLTTEDGTDYPACAAVFGQASVGEAFPSETLTTNQNPHSAQVGRSIEDITQLA